MNILLTGKNGQVGFELRRALAPLGKVVAVGHAECDLANAAEIRKLVRTVRPDVIVNPAAYTAVDKAETERFQAFAVNAHAPAVLGEEAAAIGALVVHYSTDYVFDGTKQGAYTETDETNPQSIYGASKLEGEQALAASGARHIILRTSWVVGAHGGNFAKTMLRLAAERDSLKVVADQFGTPTPARLIAGVTAHIVAMSREDRHAHFPYGVYHLAPDGVTNWHAYGCHVIERAHKAGKALRAKANTVQPITSAEYSAVAKRPANSQLDSARLRQTFGVFMPNWRDGVDHVLEEILLSSI